MVSLDNVIPLGGVLEVNHDAVTDCTPTGCSVAEMGVSLDGTDDESTLIGSMSTVYGSTRCVTNAEVPAMTPLRVTLDCVGVLADVYGPVGISTYNTADPASP